MGSNPIDWHAILSVLDGRGDAGLGHTHGHPQAQPQLHPPVQSQSQVQPQPQTHPQREDVHTNHSATGSSSTTPLATPDQVDLFGGYGRYLWPGALNSASASASTAASTSAATTAPAAGPSDPSSSSSTPSSLPNHRRSIISPVETPPAEDLEDKRVRNTLASARFRAKKKLFIETVERNIRDLETQQSELQVEVNDLKKENGLLKEMVQLKYGIKK